ncbi:MAG: hypothetical protein ACJ761_05450 [Chloroflexota bacterium]
MSGWVLPPSAQPPVAAPPGPAPARRTAGSIYDLGYQRYGGRRLGRSAAARALFTQTLRACYGIGRGGRAKIVPFGLAALAILPAVLAVGISAIASQAGGAGGAIEAVSPIRYSTYHGLTASIVMLFCAAQAPELFGRDQRYGVLQLYFSRALRREDYALAKVGGLWVALLVTILAPQLILFVGRLLVAPDPITGLRNELPSLLPAIAQAVLTAGLFGGLSAVVASFTPRRSFATAGIIALFIVPPIVVAVIDRLAGPDLGRLLVFASPGDILDGSNAALFGTTPDSPAVASLDLPTVAFVVAAAVGVIGALAVILRRYQVIEA